MEKFLLKKFVYLIIILILFKKKPKINNIKIWINLYNKINISLQKMNKLKLYIFNIIIIYLFS